jgi:hypothetical protein
MVWALLYHLDEILELLRVAAPAPFLNVDQKELAAPANDQQCVLPAVATAAAGPVATTWATRWFFPETEALN